MSALKRAFSRCARSLVCFDIDGVLLSHHSPIPRAREALQLLNKSTIPFMFLTNGSPCSEEKRLKELQHFLEIDTSNCPIIMAQSPLKECVNLHNKNVLFVGAGDVNKTAESIGFKNIININNIKSKYPLLDAVDKIQDHSKKIPYGHVPPIEGIVILDDPVNYETSIQIMIDVLFTGGHLDHSMLEYPAVSSKEMFQKIPIIATCTDFLWTTTAPWPRMAVGFFLQCFELLYHRLAGEPLKYHAIYGKPSLDTYLFLQRMINSKYGHNSFDHIYFVGDNLLTDIYGANNFQRHLKSSGSSENPLNIISVHVNTGVNKPNDVNESQLRLLHPSTDKDANLLNPHHFFKDAYEAVEYIINSTK